MPQFGIDPGDAGNRRGIDLFRHIHPRMICQPIVKHIIRLAAKNCAQIPQISLKLCIYVCAWQHNIPRILHAWILTWYFFSGWATAVFLCFSSVWMLSLSACKILYAKCIYIIETSQIIIVRKCKSLKSLKFRPTFKSLDRVIDAIWWHDLAHPVDKWYQLYACKIWDTNNKQWLHNT